MNYTFCSEEEGEEEERRSTSVAVSASGGRGWKTWMKSFLIWCLPSLSFRSRSLVSSDSSVSLKCCVQVAHWSLLPLLDISLAHIYNTDIFMFVHTYFCSLFIYIYSIWAPSSYSNSHDNFLNHCVMRFMTKTETCRNPVCDNNEKVTAHSY